MNEFKVFVGIDISKKTFDAALLKTNTSGSILHRCFQQDQEGYLLFSKWLTDNQVACNQQLLICLEHTGMYINGLVNFLVNMQANIWVEMPLRIKKVWGCKEAVTIRLLRST